MTVVNYSFNQVWPQLVKHQHNINRLVVAVLVVFLLAYAAQLTWRMWPQPEGLENTSITASVAKSSAPTNTSRLNLSQIKRLNLFGDLTAQPVEEVETVTDAPQTRLNLTLTGVVASSIKDQGAAIIENRNQQQTYGIGEKIEGTNATLREVHADRVIIKNGASNETLMLDGVDFNKPNSRPSVPATTPRSRNTGPQRRTLSNDAVAATRKLKQQPADFTAFFSIAPHRPNGQLVGYRVSPGKDPSLFKAAGLMAGDIVTEMNGLDLSDPQQAFEAINLLKELPSLSMTVQRNDESLSIYLDLPEGDEEL